MGGSRRLRQPFPQRLPDFRVIGALGRRQHFNPYAFVEGSVKLRAQRTARPYDRRPVGGIPHGLRADRDTGMAPRIRQQIAHRLAAHT